MDEGSIQLVHVAHTRLASHLFNFDPSVTFDFASPRATLPNPMSLNFS